MSRRSYLSAAMVLLVTCVMSVPAWADESGDDWEKMVFHVDEMRNAKWALMLANSYLNDSPGARIVVVAFGPGIDFLLDGTEDRRGNTFDAAVMDLAKKGVGFRVCGNTLDARNISKDRVLDDVSVVQSGLSEIARLQLKEGYAYLKP